MCGLRRIYTALFAWIYFVQVAAYYSDGLNPVKDTLDVLHQRPARVAIRSRENLACERPNVYFCEEPPDTVPPEATKTCNYRNQRHHEQVYRWVSGRGCLLFTPDFLYVGGVNSLNLNAACLYGPQLFAPCLEIPKEDGTCGCYPFDPGLEEVAQAVRSALIPAAHGRWERCFYSARECCSHYMLNDTNNSDISQCQATFDGWTCWQAAEAGTIASEVCSEFAYSGQGPSCHHFSTKECYHNATWELQTDYATCSITPRLLLRYRFHIGMLSFSIVSCLPAVFVFFFYKRLRITRVALHRNLLIAIIIRNVFVIVSRSEVYIDELTNSGDTTLSTHNVWCRALAVSERVAASAVFASMLLEGAYLHRMIVAVFRQKLNIRWMYAICTVLAIGPVVAWAIVMGLFDDHSCWLVYTVDHIQWIIDAPRLAILVVNTALFLDVFRVLLTKIRNAENANQLSTAKATLFLMPIFGIQFILTAFRPNTTDCTWEQVYYFMSYTVEGLQGFIVAILYCYVNKEVHMLVKATYKKTETAVVSRVRRDSVYPRMSTAPGYDRRMTYSTGLAPQSYDDTTDKYATIKPKLHVAEIISIQASERLAEILDPVYESVEHGITNEGYDSLNRSYADHDSGFMPNKEFKDEYYGFTNASSVSIDCQDWIRCISSPTSSVYDNNSLNDFEVKYLENKFPNKKRKSGEDDIIVPEYQNKDIVMPFKEVAQGDSEQDHENILLDEIMQYMESIETVNDEVVLDPTLLSPNRKDEDKIVFVDE